MNFMDDKANIFDGLNLSNGGGESVGVTSNDIIEDTTVSDSDGLEDNSVNTNQLVKKKGRRSRTDAPTPTELDQMSDEEVEGSKGSLASDVTKTLHDEFNSFLSQRMDVNEEDGIKHFIPTGIDVLDAILGGGFVNAFSIITGLPGTGKSMLTMQLIANVQKLYNRQKDKNGNPIYRAVPTSILDSEESITIDRLASLGVVNPKTKPINDITVEKVFKYLEVVCLFKESKKITKYDPSIVVWDSIANTLSEKEREISDPKEAIGYRPRLLSLLIPRYISKCSKYNICFVAVNQLRDSIQMGPVQSQRDLRFLTHTKEMPGGQTIKYDAFHALELKIRDIATIDKYGYNGIIDSVKCFKNKAFPPNIEVKIVGDFVRGFSNFWSNFEFLKSCSRLTAGAWNYLGNLPSIKFRTKDALNIYKGNEIFREAFNVEVKSAIDEEITKKYGYSGI